MHSFSACIVNLLDISYQMVQAMEVSKLRVALRIIVRKYWGNTWYLQLFRTVGWQSYSVSTLHMLKHLLITQSLIWKTSKCHYLIY